MLPLFLALLSLWLSAPVPEPPPPRIDTAAELIEAMRARYDGKWYRTLTFVQTSIQHRRDGGTDTTYWYEAMALPGRLRIDFDPPEAGNGLLFRADTVYSIRGGQVAAAQPQVHTLLLLGFDVYFLPPEETLRKLRDIGFDLTKMHESTWQGRPVYVVGAATDEERANQFWIDKEHLYFVRVVQPMPGGGVRETQFNRYRPLAGGWVAPEVLFYANGKVVFEEYYDAVQANVTLDPRLFDPAHWRTAPHWRN